MAQLVKNLIATGDSEDEGLISGLGKSPGIKMATHSSILAWKIPWTEVPGELQSMGLQRVRHDWAHTHMQEEQEARNKIRQDGNQTVGSYSIETEEIGRERWENITD